jgi:hypothetical protein
MFNLKHLFCTPNCKCARDVETTPTQLLDRQAGLSTANRAVPYIGARCLSGNRLAPDRRAFMSNSSAQYESGSDFRVEKARSEATLTLSNGTLVRGCFFVSGHSAAHAGPELIKDVMNGEVGFFPFEVGTTDGVRTKLYNRAHVVLVKMAGTDEARSDPGYNVATKRAVSMLFSNGLHLHGAVSVYRPPNHDRLSDYARTPGRFKYLEVGEVTYLVNADHLLELTEEPVLMTLAVADEAAPAQARTDQ